MSDLVWPLFNLDAAAKRNMIGTTTYRSNSEKSTSIDVKTPILVVVFVLACKLGLHRDVVNSTV